MKTGKEGREQDDKRRSETQSRRSGKNQQNGRAVERDVGDSVEAPESLKKE